ncbi:hypothetical protein COLO4_38131 [Corchorus olitorius]|uniref:Uncharacterized protein n=1 Tax=Corchorus olitorius TaxID=93759 RepID=A0A1R3FWV3_9ROSI|nr:hypothetical protein COLO4_38131 [Corchorus olitorius]
MQYRRLWQLSDTSKLANPFKQAEDYKQDMKMKITVQPNDQSRMPHGSKGDVFQKTQDKRLMRGIGVVIAVKEGYLNEKPASSGIQHVYGGNRFERGFEVVGRSFEFETTGSTLQWKLSGSSGEKGKACSRTFKEIKEGNPWRRKKGLWRLLQRKRKQGLRGKKKRRAKEEGRGAGRKGEEI